MLRTRDWESVRQNAERMLAVNPLVAAPHRFRGQAADQLDDTAGESVAIRPCCKWTQPIQQRFISAWPAPDGQNEDDEARRQC